MIRTIGRRQLLKTGTAAGLVTLAAPGLLRAQSDPVVLGHLTRARVSWARWANMR